MKKSLIALAVAGAMTAPIVAQADATLYGGVDTRLKFQTDKDADLQVNKAEMGVKGSSELENLPGVTASYQIEFRLDMDGNKSDTNNAGEVIPTDNALVSTIDNNSSNGVQMRKANVGLHGAFGHVIVGRQNHLTEAAETHTDIMMNAGNNFMNPDRVGNAISYVTPMMSGFEAYAQLIADGGNNTKSGNAANQKNLDAWSAGFNYSLMGLDLNLGYTQASKQYPMFIDDATGNPIVTSKNPSLWVVGAGYNIGDLGLGATYEQFKFGSGKDNKSETYALAATYALGNTTLKGVYGENFVANNLNGGMGNNDSKSYAVQAAYALGAKAGVKAEFAVLDPDATKKVNTTTFSYYVNF